MSSVHPQLRYMEKLPSEQEIKRRKRAQARSNSLDQGVSPPQDSPASTNIRPKDLSGDAVTRSVSRDLFVTGDPTKPQIVQVKCDNCDRDYEDDCAPRWHRFTGEYVSNYKRRSPHFCTTKKIWLVRRDDRIPYVRSADLYQNGRRRKETEQLGEALDAQRMHHGALSFRSTCSDKRTEEREILKVRGKS